MTALHDAKAWLDAIHPSAFLLVVATALWIGQWGVRKFAPGVWERMANLPFGAELSKLDVLMRKLWQTIPSIVGGVVAMYAATGEGNLPTLLLGAVAGAFAPLIHEAAKAAPGPYGSKPEGPE